jgi:hypothetical protein
MAKDKKVSLLFYFSKRFYAIIVLVLIWRGIWYLLDGLDERFWGGSHLWSAGFGIIIGFFLLYLLEKNSNQIENF